LQVMKVDIEVVMIQQEKTRPHVLADMIPVVPIMPWASHGVCVCLSCVRIPKVRDTRR
jgi:hypothetical protein